MPPNLVAGTGGAATLQDLTEVKDVMVLDPLLHSSATDGARRKEITVIDDVGLARAMHVLLAAAALTITGAVAGSRGGLFS